MTEIVESSNTGDVKPMFSSISSSPVITTMKLQGSNNYTAWSSSIELWFMGQGYEDHLAKSASDIIASERTKWTRIDAQLCNLLWNSLDPYLLNLFQSCKTCCKVWTKAKALYTNGIQRIYKVVSDLVQLQQNNQDMASYLGHIDTLKDQFDSLMPLSESVTTQEQQRDKFFMVWALMGLRSDLSSVRDQILASPTVPSLIEVSARLLRISSETPNLAEVETSTLAVQNENPRDQNIFQRGKGRSTRPHCNYCNMPGHTRKTCWKLHGRPPRTNNSPAANMVQTSGEVDGQYVNSITLSGLDFTNYLQYQIEKQQSNSLGTSQTGNSFACLTKSLLVCPWILDSGASDHISGPEYGEDDWNRI